MLKKLLLLLSFYANFVLCSENNNFEEVAFNFSKKEVTREYKYTLNDIVIEITIPLNSLGNLENFFKAALLYQDFLEELGRNLTNGYYIDHGSEDRSSLQEAFKIFSRTRSFYEKFKEALKISSDHLFEKILKGLPKPPDISLMGDANKEIYLRRWMTEIQKNSALSFDNRNPENERIKRPKLEK